MPLAVALRIAAGLAAAAAAGYVVYKAGQAISHAQEQEAATHEILPDGGVPQVLSE